MTNGSDNTSIPHGNWEEVPGRWMLYHLNLEEQVKKMMEPVFDVTPATSFENFSGTKIQKCSSSENQDQMLRLPRKTFTIFVTGLPHLTLFANILLVLVSSKNDVFGVTSHRSELAANRLRLVTCKNTKTS